MQEDNTTPNNNPIEKQSETPSPVPDMSEIAAQPDRKDKPLGPVIGAIIIVIVLILGGLYLWGQQISNVLDFNAMTAEEIINQEDPTLESLQTQGSSDALSTIENDLNATDLSNLDQELDQIEEELSF